MKQVHNFFQKIKVFLVGLQKQKQLKREANKTRHALESMSDYDLRDIGISRGDIPYIAFKSATGK